MVPVPKMMTVSTRSTSNRDSKAFEFRRLTVMGRAETETVPPAQLQRLSRRLSCHLLTLGRIRLLPVAGSGPRAHSVDAGAKDIHVCTSATTFTLHAQAGHYFKSAWASIKGTITGPHYRAPHRGAACRGTLASRSSTFRNHSEGSFSQGKNCKIASAWGLKDNNAPARALR